MSFDEEPDGDPHGECATEIHRLQAENVGLLDALQSSVEVIKQWHNMDGSDEATWTIYYENAPEMQPIRAAIARLTPGRGE